MNCLKRRLPSLKHIGGVGLTTIEALDSLRLVSILHALYDSMMAAKTCIILGLPLR